MSVVPKTSKGSLLGCFMVKGEVYQHHIFTREDDRVECTNENGDVVLTFGSSCNVYNIKGEKIGCALNRGDGWSFKLLQNGEIYPMNYWDDLIKSELEFAKLYLRGDLDAHLKG